MFIKINMHSCRDNKVFIQCYPGVKHLEKTRRVGHDCAMKTQSSRRRLLPDEDTLVTVFPGHDVICVVCNGKYMWRKFTDLCIFVFLYVFSVVDWIKLIWIHCNQYGSSVSLKMIIYNLNHT
jgi:hypothetical protein